MTTATTPSPAEEHFRNEAHGEGHEEHPSDLKYVGSFVVLIVVLLFRPQGLLGRRERIG